MNKLFVKIGIFAAIVSLFACTGGDSSPGYEYMPNMYRSPSIETYGEHIIKRDTSYMIDGYTGLPVEGTIARGKLSTFNYDSSDFLLAGEEATYPDSIYRNTTNGKIVLIPFNQDQKMSNQGKELFGMMCAHCHGSTGKGDGPIATASFPNNPYTNTPAFNNSQDVRSRNNLPMTEFTEGHIFHTITYGLGAMGAHASQISESERWKIVYYIQQELQK